MMYDTDQCLTHLNSLFVCYCCCCFVCVGGGSEGCLSLRMVLCVDRLGGTVLYVCIEYHIQVNMYHVSAQGVDKRMINVQYCYYYYYCHYYYNH